MARNLEQIDLLVFTGPNSPALYRRDIAVKSGFIEYQGTSYPFDMLIPCNSEDGTVRYVLPVSAPDLIDSKYFEEMRKKVVFKSVVQAADNDVWQVAGWAKSFVIAVLLWLAYSNSSSALESANRSYAAIDQVNKTLAKPLVIQGK